MTRDPSIRKSDQTASDEAMVCSGPWVQAMVLPTDQMLASRRGGICLRAECSNMATSSYVGLWWLVAVAGVMATINTILGKANGHRLNRQTLMSAGECEISHSCRAGTLSRTSCDSERRWYTAPPRPTHYTVGRLQLAAFNVYPL